MEVGSHQGMENEHSTVGSDTSEKVNTLDI
jgi:hypothetical protein